VSGGILDFDWLVAPKRVGEHVIMLWIERRCSFNTMSRATQGPALRPIMIPISVVNEFGFSAASEAILKGITGVLGIIALICGLPFLRRVFERRAQINQQDKPIRRKLRAPSHLRAETKKV
jgi:hypothetical protein